MDGFERVALRQRKQLRTIGAASIVFGLAIVVATVVNDDMYRAVGGTLHGIAMASAFIVAGAMAIWRAYKKT